MMERDEVEIRQLVVTWIEATKAGDIDKVLSLMTDDVVFLLPGQQSMVGKQAFADASRPAADGSQMTFDGISDIQEVVVSGDLAYLWSRLKVIVTPSDGHPPITRAGFTLTVLRKEKGRWLLARDANLLSPVADAE